MQLVKEIMTKDPEIVHSSTKLIQAAKKMKDLNIGFLVVGDGNKLIGCVTDRDIVVEGVARGINPKEHQVEEVMTPNLVTCEANTKVTDAIRLMKEQHIYRLVVTDTEGNPVGVVSFGDLANRIEEDIPIQTALRDISRGSNRR